MTTLVTILNRGPDSIQVEVINKDGLVSGIQSVSPGRFVESYVYQSQDIRIVETKPNEHMAVPNA